MMILTRRWRSRRHLRRTYSTKHTGLTVSQTISLIKHYLFLAQVFLNHNHGFFFFSFAGEIALLEGLTVVYKSNIDLFFYVIGSSHENEVSLIKKNKPSTIVDLLWCVEYLFSFYCFVKICMTFMYFIHLLQWVFILHCFISSLHFVVIAVFKIFYFSDAFDNILL